MKKIILLAVIFCVNSPIYAKHTLRCEIQNQCILHMSKCRTYNDLEYDAQEGILDVVSGYSYRLKENVICLNKRGQQTKYSRVQSSLDAEMTSVLVEELRIPADIDGVPEEYIRRANELTLLNCQERQLIMTDTFGNCKNKENK